MHNICQLLNFYKWRVGNIHSKTTYYEYEYVSQIKRLNLMPNMFVKASSF